MTIRNGWRALSAAVVLSLALPSAAMAAEQAERALAAVRALLASGEVKRDAQIKVAFKPGNISALLGPELELQKEWEQKTGVIVSARVIPQQAGVTNLREHPDVDITVVRTHEYPDLLDQSMVEDLAPMARQFGLELDGNPPNGFIRPRLQGYFGDRLVAIPADGDVCLLYVRRDLIEDPEEKKAFRKAFGRELAMPKTWQDYEQLIAFFHRPEKGMYGAAEERDPSGGWMYWLPRYLDRQAPFRGLFDDSMRPLIDSPAGIAATESYVRTVRVSPPEVLVEGNDYSYTLPVFLQGKAFSTVFTIAGAKLFNSASSAVRGRFSAIPLPGQMHGNRLVRNNIPIYGNNLVVSSRSTQKKLAFLFAMWLSDPDVSLRTVGIKGGFTDPFRWNHLGDARIADLYSPDALKAFRGEWAVTQPPGAGVPGDGEYLGVLDRHLWLAAKGEITPADAMRRTAQEWDRITDRRGRPRQIEWQRKFVAGFTIPDAQAAKPAAAKAR
jgi:multiple sugar transport system substrate-binding protein